MYRGIAPSLVEEATGAVQVLEVCRVRLTAPERKTANLKVRPEVAGAVSVCGGVVGGAVRAVRHPAECAVRVEVLVDVVAFGEEALRLGPERRDGEGGVVEIDGEAVRLVAVLHVAEDVVVNVAEEVHVGLDAPVVVHVGEGGVVWEEAGVPAAHLVVADLVGILDAVFGEDLGGLGVEGRIYPWGCGPVLARDGGKGDLSAGFGADGTLEGFGEGFIVEESPWVVELVVESLFEVADGLDELVELGIADEGEEGRFYAVGFGIVEGVVVAVDTVERTWGFVDCCPQRSVGMRD